MEAVSGPGAGGVTAIASLRGRGRGDVDADSMGYDEVRAVAMENFPMRRDQRATLRCFFIRAFSGDASFHVENSERLPSVLLRGKACPPLLTLHAFTPVHSTVRFSHPHPQDNRLCLSERAATKRHRSMEFLACTTAVQSPSPSCTFPPSLLPRLPPSLPPFRTGDPSRTPSRNS